MTDPRNRSYNGVCKICSVQFYIGCGIFMLVPVRIVCVIFRCVVTLLLA